MTNKEIGEKIRAMRLSRGMTQDELADAIGMSASAVAMYEAGRRRPKDDAAEALADTFNVPKWSIYYREDEMVPADSASSKLHQIGDQLTAPSNSFEFRNLSGGLAKMEKENQAKFQPLYTFLITTYPEYFSERNDDDDTES